MKYMKKFLLKDNCKALYDIGDDAPSIFFEIWYDHLNSKVCVYRLVSEVGIFGGLVVPLLGILLPTPTSAYGARKLHACC